jgi:hypothetical protein
MAVAVPTRRVYVLATGGGILDDPTQAAELRDRELPPSALPGPTTIVLDLADLRPTPRALKELIVPLGQRMRGGVYGDMKLVVAGAGEADEEVINLLAEKYDFPLFLARTSSSEDVEAARPAGDLTSSEVETLDKLRDAGGGATVAGLAGVFGLGATAVNNRLLNLERKGYVYRLRRSKRSGDLYIDPRADAGEMLMVGGGAEDVPTIRSALLASGIRSDPYDRSRLVLEGEAAERAAEILRRRGKAT